MNTVTSVALAGGLIGCGVWLIATGLAPARPPLHVLLGRLGQSPVEVEPASGDDVDVRIGRWARKIGLVERSLTPMRADLRILHRSPEEQAALVITYGVLGLLFVPVIAAGGYAAGIQLPLAVPLWLGLVGAAIGLFWAIRAVKPEAAKRRRSFSHALSAFCDVCSMSLAAGRGVESSIEAAANAGGGWPFIELQTALRTGYVRGDTPWDALAQLGRDADLVDLVELAAGISLAGNEGAAVREMIGSKARTIRERLTSDAERNAASITERMGIPATFLLLGFILFLGFPAIAVMFK